jgi:hypothetical protein
VMRMSRAGLIYVKVGVSVTTDQPVFIATAVVNDAGIAVGELTNVSGTGLLDTGLKFFKGAAAGNASVIDMTEVSLSGGVVTSVNGEAGVVVLDAAKVGALTDSYVAPVTSVNGEAGVVVLDAAKVGALTDSYVAPVTSVNGEAGVVVLDAAKVGALPDSYVAPVTSVNGEAGVVVLDAAKVGALTDAASDGKQYARQDAAWTEVPAGTKSKTTKK